jgi:hypothetical protein
MILDDQNLQRGWRGATRARRGCSREPTTVRQRER